MNTLPYTLMKTCHEVTHMESDAHTNTHTDLVILHTQYHSIIQGLQYGPIDVISMSYIVSGSNGFLPATFPPIIPLFLFSFSPVFLSLLLCSSLATNRDSPLSLFP